MLRYTVFPKKTRGHSMCSTMVGGAWRLAVGGDWRLAVGNWRLVAVGGGWRRLVVGGWWLVAVGTIPPPRVNGPGHVSSFERGGPLARGAMFLLSKGGVH